MQTETIQSKNEQIAVNDIAVIKGYCHYGHHVTDVPPNVRAIFSRHWELQRRLKDLRERQRLERMEEEVKRQKVVASQLRLAERENKGAFPDRVLTCGSCCRKMDNVDRCWKCGWTPGEIFTTEEQMFLEVNKILEAEKARRPRRKRKRAS